MPIHFRHNNEVEELGSAAYLKIAQYPAEYMGALFVVNGLCEPLEFTYTRVEVPNTFLWRPADIRRHATRKLAASLLSLCPQAPRLLLCLAEEVDSDLFCQDIHVSIPVCRVAPKLAAAPYSGQEARDEADADEPLHLFWFPDRPTEGSVEQRLIQQLSNFGLLLEPFDRAVAGLQEVYK